MKTSDLTGAQLDYWVAKAEGLDPELFTSGCAVNREWYSPSINWAQGGPIIERCGISLNYRGGEWMAMIRMGQVMMVDESPLVAAMLALVVLKFGFNLPDDV